MPARRALVIGAGLSGLASALYLRDHGWEVEVKERETTPGGLLQTETTEFGPVEYAANGFYATGRVEALLDRLGLEIVPAAPQAKAKYLYRDGMRRWPLGPGGTMRFAAALPGLMANRGKARPMDGESVEQWGHRVFGQAFTRHLLLPALQGIYATSSGLSAPLVLGPMFGDKTERPARGQYKGTISVPGGMGSVIDSLTACLREQGVVLQMGESVESLPTGDFDAIVVATPAAAASRLVRSLDPERAERLARITSADVGTHTLFLDARASARRGFGCLFPRESGFRTMGVLFNHHVFPSRYPDGIASETWLFDPSRLPSDPAERLEAIREERAAVRGLSVAEITFHRSRIWQKAIPRYDRVLEEALRDLSPGMGNVYFTGNYWGRLGVAHLVERGARLADAIDADTGSAA